MPTDAGLAALREIERTALGQAWMGDAFGRDPILAREKRGVIERLSRRHKLVESDAGVNAPPMFNAVSFEATWMHAFSRLLRWLVGVLWFALGDIGDRLRRRASTARRAERLRHIFERMGPTFVKLGQQLAMRADVIPYEYCRELMKMLDDVPPFDAEVAMKMVVEATGQPIEETFSVFDPDPIGSASLSCVYQAILHNGDQVAVKVRRPEIGPSLAADLKALFWMVSIADMLTMIRGDMSKNLRMELRTMLMEELDFRREARYTELFRARAREFTDSLITAPRVYFPLSSEDVLVTEFIGGVYMTEILGALESDDESALQYLRDRDIDPVVLAKRMVRIFNWETLEGLVYHSDPHPANMVVRPGNEIVFLDFGACGRFTSKTRRAWQRLHYHLDNEDVQGVVEASISLMEPLPPVDIHRFTKELELLYWDWLYALKSNHAEWYERSTGLLWMKLVGVARKYHVPISLDTLRTFRTIFAYDAIMYRLWSKLDPEAEYAKWRKQAGLRIGKKIKKEAKKRLEHGPTPDDWFRINEMLRLSNQVFMRLQQRLDQPDMRFGHMLGKASYLFSVGLKLTAMAILIHFAFLTVLVGYNEIYLGQDWALGGVFRALISSTTYQVVMGTFALLVIRKVLSRLEDIDVYE